MRPALRSAVEAMALCGVLVEDEAALDGFENIKKRSGRLAQEMVVEMQVRVGCGTRVVRSLSPAVADNNT